jgi:hypothetical protein
MCLIDSVKHAVIRFALFRCKPVNCEQWLGICLSISTWKGMEWIRVTVKASDCWTHRRRSLAILMLISEATARGPCENRNETSKPATILCESNTAVVVSCQVSTAVASRSRLRKLLGHRRWRAFLRNAENTMATERPCPEDLNPQQLHSCRLYIFNRKSN